MYEQFYGLTEKPFSVTSSPSFLYLSQKHKEALAALVYGIRERVGFIQLTGEVGTGKTTVCRALLNELDDKIKTAYIFNPDLSGQQLLETIVEDLGIPVTKKNKASLFSALNRFLLGQIAEDQTTVLIIDEAQNMSLKTLEKLRMLSNLEAENQKLLQIVLVGQPELRKKLDDPRLRQLRQRIVVRHHMEALPGPEIPPYIEHRLKIAGSRNGLAPVFQSDALDEILIFSGGIPRLINLVCDKALLTGYVSGERHINGQTIKRSVQEIEGCQP